MAQQEGSVLAAGNAPGRPGEHTSRCQSHRLGNGSDPTMRLNDQDWRTQSRLTQPQFEARKVALQSRAMSILPSGRIRSRTPIRRSRGTSCTGGG